MAHLERAGGGSAQRVHMNVVEMRRSGVPAGGGVTRIHHMGGRRRQRGERGVEVRDGRAGHGADGTPQSTRVSRFQNNHRAVSDVRPMS